MRAATGSKRLHELIPSKYDRIALTTAVVLLVALSTASAFAIRPLPFSDWLYYWEVARGAVRYERGGVLVFVLRLLQALSLQPYTAALAMNLASAFAILALAYRGNTKRIGIAPILVLAYLLAITPYYSVIQFDLPATALLCGGLFLLAADASGKRRVWFVVASVALVSSAVSSRPQFFLLLLVFGTLLVLAAALVSPFRGVASNRIVVSAVLLIMAAILGFALDSALRAGAGRADAIRTTSGVTLYAGLLSSETSGPNCGHWSVQATRDAREDAELPLVQAVSQRLKERTLRHWLEVVRCKAPSIVLPRGYALSWSMGAPNVVERMNASHDFERVNVLSSRLYRIEHLVYWALLTVIYVFTLVVVMRRISNRQWMAALLPVLWISSYWFVHVIFEIQARYFLSLFLLLLFMTASGMSSLFDKGLPSASKRDRFVSRLEVDPTETILE